MFDIDKGLKGTLVHHKPLNNLQLKRLLLIFDELHFTPPEDNIHFLEKGAICYRYQIEKDRKILYSLDGHDLLKKYSHLKEPEVPKDSLAIASVLRIAQNSKLYPFDPIILTDVLPYFKGQEFQKKEERLFEKFEKAINKDHIKIIDYKSTDFYLKNAIPLKIAYDYDVNDSNSIDIVKPLFVDKITKSPNMFFPSPSFPERTDFKYFPRVEYNSKFRNNKDNLKYDYERQFFSVIAKVNKKLALAEKFNLIPIIIDDSIHNYYQHKIGKSKKNSDVDFNNEWNISNDYKLMNLNNLLFKSSNIFISDNQLSQISISEILNYKERCINELHKLRKGIFPEINNIVNTNFDFNDLKEINRLIGKKIIPEFHKYQELQNSILAKTVKTTIKYSVGVGSAYFGFAQGLSPLLISLLSGASPLLADDILKLSDKFKDKRKSKYENTFSYFLNLNKHK
ncbi:MULTISPECIES: hypothetical protein [Flavobacteriaceae]|uniref:Uncharacterized protein n=2 Tax=Flavobacteriaceae TaxID=49546 RepID=A0A4Y8ART5_9FLAO|nr:MULTISPECIES: hypothetical protein [Flavobacteriaceae]TEW73910.1 hypothetical protein E2488_10555 [Gramella jeungdoensis]GGK38675.1 hypothetical protein GCM10007963_03430 [Lutibacter litoralis]